jgi:hypothetical protein
VVTYPPERVMFALGPFAAHSPPLQPQQPGGAETAPTGSRGVQRVSA